MMVNVTSLHIRVSVYFEKLPQNYYCFHKQLLNKSDATQFSLQLWSILNILF